MSGALSPLSTVDEGRGARGDDGVTLASFSFLSTLGDEVGEFSGEEDEVTNVVGIFSGLVIGEEEREL